MADAEAPAIALIDKPVGPTSRRAVDRVAEAAGTRAAGHAGTLDPLASGLLIVLVGRACRLQDLSMGLEKEYEVDVTFGVESETDDLEGPVRHRKGAVIPDAAAVLAALPRFTGAVEQRPPAASAIRIDGERFHRLLRTGRGRVPPSRVVRIGSIDLLRYFPPVATLRVVCGSGTYMRSLARDLGDALGAGGLVSRLRRTRIGRFTVGESVPLAEFGVGHIAPVEAHLPGLPRADIAAEESEPLLSGKAIPAGAREGAPGEVLLLAGGRIFGRGRRDEAGNLRLTRWIGA